MARVRVEIDDSQVEAVFKALDAKKQRRMFRSGLRKSANILVRKARQILARKVKRINHENKTFGKLKDGIKTYVRPNMAIVSINNDLRLRLFEKGNYKTSPRKTKGRKKVWTGRFKRGKREYERTGKGHETGDINPSKFHFFDTAKDLSEREVFSSITNNIKQSIQNAILKGKNRYVK